MRGGLQLCGEVGRVGHQSDVVDLVLRRHDGQTVVEQHVCPVDGLEILLATLTMVVEHLQHIFPEVSFPGHTLQLLYLLRIMHEAIGGIPALSHPTPGGPSPDAEGRGEEIAVVAVGCRLVDIEACHHRDTFIVFITVEHLLAEREERLRRHHIIFQDDHLVGQRKGPAMTAEAGGVAALVMVEVAAMHLTRPVDVLVGYYLATSLDACPVALTPWSVLIEQELRGSSLAHGFEHLRKGVAAGEEQQQDGDIGLGRMFHVANLRIYS